MFHIKTDGTMSMYQGDVITFTIRLDKDIESNEKITTSIVKGDFRLEKEWNEPNLNELSVLFNSSETENLKEGEYEFVIRYYRADNIRNTILKTTLSVMGV